MTTGKQQPEPGRRLSRWLAPLIGAALVGMVFTIVVLSGASAVRERPPARITANPPAPVVPPPPPPPESEPRNDRNPASATPAPETVPDPPPALALEPVPLHLDIAADASRLRLADTSGLGASLSTREQIEQFTFNDLDQPPRALHVPPPRIPRRLADQGFRSGVVTFLIHINRSGQVSVLDVLETTEPALVRPAREVAERARFAPPTIDGEPVEVTGRWPLSIQTR